MSDNSSICSGSQAIVDVVKLLMKEIQTSAIQSVPFDIYLNTANIIGVLKISIFEGLEGSIRNAVVEMLSESIDLLFEARYKKMIEDLEAISGTSISTGTASTSIDYSKLTDEEKYFLEASRALGKRRKDILNAVITGSPKVLELFSKEAHSKQIVIMFLKPMEPFMGVDMNKYGPFLAEDVTALPSENARSLIEKNFAVEVQSRL